MKYRLLYAPIPILITVALILLDFFTVHHTGVVLLLSAVAAGGTYELTTAYCGDEPRTVMILLSVTPFLWVLWIGYLLLGVPGADNLFHPWGSQSAPSLSYLIYPAPLLLASVLVFGLKMFFYGYRSMTGTLTGISLMVLFVLLFSHGIFTLSLFSEHPNQGTLFLLFLGVLNKLSDTGAFLTGRAVGTTRMTPNLSPKKTWEGVGGALLTGVATGVVFWWLTPISSLFTFVSVLLLSLLLAVSGIFGDLAGSLLKRGANLDDSSQLFPEIGGVLDMADSFLVSLPAAYFWCLLVL